jgi:hypothetical protein
VREIRFFIMRGASATQGSLSWMRRAHQRDGMATMVQSVANDAGPTTSSNGANRNWMQGWQGIRPKIRGGYSHV